MQSLLGPTHPSPDFTGRGGPLDHEYNHTRSGQMSVADVAASTQGTQYFFPLQSYVWVIVAITDDTSGLNDICYDPDPVDIANADAYKELLYNESAMANHDQTATQSIPDEASGFPELMEQEDQTEGHTDFAPPQGMTGMPTPVVDRFPFGCPGMPILNKPQGSSMYEKWRSTSNDSLWTPFCSELD